MQPIGSNGFGVTTLGALRPKAAFLHWLQSLFVHEPTNAILPALDPLAAQHLLDTPAAVSMAAFQENEGDLLGQQSILLTPSALVLASVIVQAAAADSQSQAHFDDTVAGGLGSHLGDHFVESGGSWPKMPKAFFTGYGADMVGFFSDATLTCPAPIRRPMVPTDRDGGRMKNIWNRPTSRSFWGWPRKSLGSEPAFLSGSPLRPTRLSFELEEIVVRWPNG